LGGTIASGALLIQLTFIAAKLGGHAMAIQVPPLLPIFMQLRDWRKPRGKRYSSPALLVLALAGLLCGKRGPTELAHWCDGLLDEVLLALTGRTDHRPSPATFCRLFWNLDVDEVEAACGAWAEAVHGQWAPAGQLDGEALDGKTLRGAAKRGAKGAHLLSVISHRLKLVLGQVAVDDKTNESGAILPLLQRLVLEGRVFTMDALLTQRPVAQTIVDGRGDYVMVVKGNQPQLEASIAQVLDAAPVPEAGEVRGQARTVDKRHGRLEVRELETSAVLHDYLDWPGQAQVARLRRSVTNLKTGALSVETVHLISSLTPERAGPSDLLTISRQHWTIENCEHWVRDVDWGEDACAVHKRTAHQALAAWRNLALSLIHAAGWRHVAAVLDYLSGDPLRAFRLLGVPVSNR
jgi:predicted transposase YbfD/YdcC